MTVREALKHGGRLHSMSRVLPCNVSQDLAQATLLSHALLMRSSRCIMQTKWHVENNFDIKDDLLTI